MNTITTYENKGARRTLSALILTLLAWALFSGQVLAQSYGGPLVITKGGTYTGNWESRDSEVAAVDVRTSEPVVIVNSNIRGAGYLIKSWGHAANITVKNTNGYGLTPTPFRDYKKPRRFLTVNNFKNIVVENCYLEGTAGIYVGTRYEGDGSTNNTVKIRYNKAKNIDGRVYGGQREHSQFAQFNYRGNLPHAEIAWNEVINEPNKSLVEDNINLSNSRGTSASPIRIHNNYIQGAYPYPATEIKFSGGGIIADSWYQDGMGDPAAVSTAYVKVHDNQTVNIGNYNYAIAGANNIEVYNNRGVNSGLFDDGTRMNTHNVGIYGYDYYKSGATFNAVMRNNVTGVMSQGNLFDKNYFPDGLVKNENNPYIGGNITKQHEKNEYSAWLAKLSSNGIVLGPNGSTPTTQPAPAPTDPVATTPTTPSTDISVGTTTGTGKITRDLWSNVHGSTVAAIPVGNKPNSTNELTIFEAPGGQGNNYGQRIRGYVTAPASGQYTFWIAADDAAELYLSTSEDPAKKVKIASSGTWTNAREWTKSASQQSAKITLEAGKRYYIEALMLQGGGGDNLAVGWQLPSGAMERPIAGNRLSQMGSTAPAPAVTATITAPAGKITRDLWSNVHGSTVAAIPVGNKPNSTNELTIFEAPGGQGNNYGQRIRGYVTAPASGQYTFWIAADDAAELYLSTSEDPAKKVNIASSGTWTNAREWTKSASQQSAKITLEAGKRYYIEALMLQGGGGDNLAVGWQLPSGAMERPIAGNRLSPIEGLIASTTSALQAETTDSNISFEKVTAYPNPFNDVVTLDLGSEKVTLKEVVILDQTSTVVYTENNLTVENNKLVINLAASGLRAGLYLLKYTDSTGKSYTIRLIKE